MRILRVLALETSERIGTLATLQVNHEQHDGQVEVVQEITLPAEQRSARSLLPSLQSILSESGWQPNELDLLCVSTGPGSFTGLRLGVTAAKTLAYAVGAELVEVHTLATIAAGVKEPFERLWTILDAQRQELFVAQFDGQGDTDWRQAETMPETRIVRIDDWLQELQPGDVVSGPPLAKLAERLPTGVTAAAAECWKPQAVEVGRLGLLAQQRGQLVNAIQLVPRYYRKSAAEEKAERKE